MLLASPPRRRRKRGPSVSWLGNNESQELQVIIEGDQAKSFTELFDEILKVLCFDVAGSRIDELPFAARIGQLRCHRSGTLFNDLCLVGQVIVAALAEGDANPALAIRPDRHPPYH